MFVVAPIKFHIRGVKIAGIHYPLPSIGIEALLKALGGALTQILNISKMEFLVPKIFKISSLQIFLLIFQLTK